MHVWAVRYHITCGHGTVMGTVTFLELPESTAVGLAARADPEPESEPEPEAGGGAEDGRSLRTLEQEAEETAEVDFDFEREYAFVPELEKRCAPRRATPPQPRKPWPG